MISLLRFIAIAVAAQFVVTAAFVSNGSHSPAYRSPSTTQTYMAGVAAPEKTEKKQAADESDTEDEAAKDRGWLVRLYNDPYNKREFVARCLMEVCGLDDGMAFNVMMKAHQIGIGVIGNYPQELAELYKGRLSGEGLLIDMVPADDE
ncbi:hypothetical protein ACHAXR_005082 [Thalassiosira sp. AJA248-18]